jgi:hypothetical protein
MKRTKLIFFLMLSVIVMQAQELAHSYYYTDGYSIIPKMTLERKNDIVIPYSITKNDEKKAGILYLNKDNSVKDAVLFEGENNYVINEVIEAANGNLLVSAEGYSEQGQESLYFIELNEGGIVNDFVFNEGGNELDPFAILEVGENILIGGFIKSRELVSNSFYNMYSETQMIYIGEFSKSGDKVWSKGIEIEGFEKGICNKMIRKGNDVFLLCHANKIGQDMSPFLIKINMEGEVQSIIQIYRSNGITIGSDLTVKGGVVELFGTSSKEDMHYFFLSKLSIEFSLLRNTVFELPYRFNIEGVYENKYLFGSVITNSRGYDNAFIERNQDKFSFSFSGGERSDLTTGIIGDFYYSYTIGGSKIKSSVFNINRKEDVSSVNLIESELVLKFENDFNVTYETKFIKSNINKGVSRVLIKKVANKIFEL